MIQAQSRSIELAYETAGDGAPVVLLHGFPFNRTMWREQVEALARGGYKIITPDLRGMGETAAPDDEPATMKLMALDVAALMNSLGIERAVICGLSMGGYVTLAFYSLLPQRARALVLANTRAQADSDEARRTREEQAGQILKEGMSPLIETLLPKVLTKETLAEKSETAARVREMILNTSRSGAAAALRGMARRRDLTDMLAHINVPTLVIAGSEDTITPPGVAEAMSGRIPGAQLEVIEGASHLSNLERPAQFNRALEQFLAGLPIA